MRAPRTSRTPARFDARPDTSSSTSPEARHPPPHTVWLSAGIPYLPAVCGGPKPHSNCGVAVWLALQCLSDRAGLSPGEPRETDRPSRAALHCCPGDHRAALADALAGRHAHKSPTGLGLVPHAVERCHTRDDAPGQTGHRGVRSNRAPLAPRDRLGVETGQAGGQR